MSLRGLQRRGFLGGLGAAAFAGGAFSPAAMLRAQANGNIDPVRLLLGSHMDYLAALTDAYAERFGAQPTVDMITTPDLPVRLNSSFIARRDVGDAVFSTAQLCVGLAEREWLTDLTDLVNDKLLPNGLLPNSLTAATFNDRIYGVPVTIGCPIMHWNKDLLEAADLDPEAPANWHAEPGSWDKMVEYAKAITDPDNNIYGITDNWGGTGSIFTFGALIQMHGGSLLDGAQNPVMNSDAGVEALTRMVELMHDHQVVDPSVTTYTWVFDASPGYLAGRRGFFFTWPFISGIANTSEDSAVQGRSGAAPNPSVLTSASVDGSEYLTVPVFARNPEDGRQFIELATSLEKQILQGSTSPWAPSIEGALGHPDVQANLPVAEIIRQSYLYPVDGGYSADRERWVEILTGQISRAVNRQSEPRAALDEAVRQIEASRG